jgi:hypothetical protein
VELVGGLSLHHKLPIDNHVEAVLSQVLTLIKDLDGDLAGNMMLSRDELALEGHHVHMFEKTIAQIIVNLEECADHGMGEAFFEKFERRHKLKMAR